MRYSYNSIDIDKNIDEIINDYCHELDIIDFEFICKQANKQIKKDGLYNMQLCDGVGHSLKLVIYDENDNFYLDYIDISDYDYKDVNNTLDIYHINQLMSHETFEYLYLNVKNQKILFYIQYLIKKPLNTVVTYKSNECQLKYKFYKELKGE